MRSYSVLPLRGARGDRRRGLLVISRASRISITAREMPEFSWNARQAATLEPLPSDALERHAPDPSVVVLNPQLAPLDATRSPRRAPSPTLHLLLSASPTRQPVVARVPVRAEQITQAECHRARRGPPSLELLFIRSLGGPSARLLLLLLRLPLRASLSNHLYCTIYHQFFVFLAFSLDFVCVCVCVCVSVCVCARACVSLYSLQI